MPALSAWPGIASGAPLTVTGAFQILDTRTANSANIAAGTRHQFGAVSVVPNGAAGTTGTASRGAAIGLPVEFQPFDTLPNFFSNSVNAFSQHPSATGGWTLTFTNGPDTATVVTPSIAGATILPFARNVSMQGSGLAPTFTWAFPATAATTAIDAVGITIRDLSDRRGTGGVGGEGVANIIYSQTFAASTRTFTLNPTDPALTTPVAFGRNYSLEIRGLDLRNPSGGAGVPNTLSRSRTFVDFTPLSPPGPPAGGPPPFPHPVALPIVDTSGPVPIFRFPAIPVIPTVRVWLDPLVAFGYDYQIGTGDPNFASLTLPEGIGDSIYDLWLWNGTDWTDTGIDLIGGQEFFFGAGGVDRFRVTGIETDAMVDPFSATAFISGLTFVSEGEFTGTMTPLVLEVALETPEPSSITLVLASALIFACSWRRRVTPSASPNPILNTEKG